MENQYNSNVFFYKLVTDFIPSSVQNKIMSSQFKAKFCVSCEANQTKTFNFIYAILIESIMRNIFVKLF